MRLALILCSTSALLCLVNGLGQSETTAGKSSSGSSLSPASGYPKKVTTLKKRPTKSSSLSSSSASASASASTISSSNISSRSTTSNGGTTTKPSKPRVKYTKSIMKATTTTSLTATTRMPTKAPELAESFTNLPDDDLEFIKELDKQFKLHGEKIKIKVERDNSTGSNGEGGGKNSKRTIDGDLGYGYAHQGYDYTPPKFMFYPYSQHDIPATESPDAYGSYSPSGFELPQTSPQHQQQVTSVTIEPSYSYELKPQTSYETQAPPAQEQHQHQELEATAPEPEQPQIDLPHGAEQQHDDNGGYQEPVIVLRIPGPAKYAAHLQALLQQYLEIRAAQYLSLLQEAEQRKQLQHQQEPVVQYQPEVNYNQQEPVQYAAIDDVYQTYKGRHQQQQQQQQQQQHYVETQQPDAYYGAPSVYQQDSHQQTQFYYAQPQQASYDPSYQQQPQLYLIAMAAPQQQQEQQQQQHQHQQYSAPEPIYVPEQDQSQSAEESPVVDHSHHHHHHHHHHDHDLPITENNPRPTHTKVIFNTQNHGGSSHMYATIRRPYEAAEPQPSSQEIEQHAQPESSQDYHHHQQQAQQPLPQQEQQPPPQTHQRPFNYHAHGLKQHQNQSKRSAKSTAATGPDQRLQEIRDYVREKLGAEMGSAVEYKTTQLLEG